MSFGQHGQTTNPNNALTNNQDKKQKLKADKNHKKLTYNRHNINFDNWFVINKMDKINNKQ